MASGPLGLFRSQSVVQKRRSTTERESAGSVVVDYRPFPLQLAESKSVDATRVLWQVRNMVCSMIKAWVFVNIHFVRDKDSTVGGKGMLVAIISKRLSDRFAA